jgi:hypothetical protein
MAKQLITGRKVVNLTSNTSYDPWYVGDFMMLTVSISSSHTYPHAFNLEGSNADGFQAPIPENSWSRLTSSFGGNQLGAAGVIATIDPGFRWIRSSTSTSAGAVSAASAFTITFVGRT